jgi:hypothetical protein
MTGRKETPLFRCHHPRKRMIQYAAAPRLIISASGILGRPVKPGDPRKRMIQYAAASRFIISASGILGRPVKPGDDTFAPGDDSFALGDDGCGLGRAS